MAADSTTSVIALSAQALLILSLIGCSFCAKLPGKPDQAQDLKSIKGAIPSSTVPVGAHNSVPIVSSTDDFEVVAHTGLDGLGGRQKRYIGWGRRPSLRYSKATSNWDHDSLFNRLHNNFDKRFGPEAPISSFRELRMKQKTPNIQLLLPHLQMRNTRVPAEADGEDVPPGFVINDMERPGGKLTQEDLDALAYLLEGDIQ